MTYIYKPERHINLCVEVHKIVDGDTMYLFVEKAARVDLGFGHYQTVQAGEQYIKVRLLDVDTWETRGEQRPLGIRAKEFAELWFERADQIWVETFKDEGDFEQDKGKYGRWLALIGTDSELKNETLNQALAASEHVKAN